MEALAQTSTSLEHIPEPIREIIGRVKRDLTEYYGDRMQRLILFGSYARGDFHEESDIDLMPVLNSSEAEIRAEQAAISNIAYQYMEKYLASVSVMPVGIEKFEKSATFFLMFVQKDGIEL